MNPVIPMKIHEAIRPSVRLMAYRFFLAVFSFAVWFSPWFYGLTRLKDQLSAQILIFFIFLPCIPLLKIETLFRLNLKSLDSWVFCSLLIGFAYVLISVIPWRSLELFSRFFSVVLVYWMTRTLVDTEKKFDFLLWVIFLMGAFYSIYGLLQYRGYLPKDFWYQDAFLAARLVNGGHFAAFLLFPIFFGLCLLVRSGLLSRILIATLLFIQFFALLLTRSRTVWIAVALGIFIWVFFSLAKKTVPRKTLWGIVIVFLGIGLGLGQKFLPVIVERFAQVRSVHEVPFYTVVFRLELWQACLEAFRVRPWGWGIGTFSAVFPQFRIGVDRFLIDYAHNEFFQIAVDFGMAGIALLLGFLGFYLKTALKLLTQTGENDPLPLKSRCPSGSPEAEKISRSAVQKSGPREQQLVLFFSLFIGVVLSCQFDFPLRIYSNGILFAVFLALSGFLFDRLSSPPPLSGERSRADKSGECPPPATLCLGVRAAVFFAVLGFGIFTAAHLYAQFQFEKAQKFEKNFEFDRANPLYEKAVQWMPFSEVYRRGLGLYLDKSETLMFDSRKKAAVRNRAEAAFRDAVRLNPYEAANHYYLALVLEKNGDDAQSEEEFRKAEACDPKSGFYTLEYGYYALRKSEIEKAVSLFAKLRGIPISREYSGGSPQDIVSELWKKTRRYDDLRRVIPDEPYYHYYLGARFAADGQWNFAKTEFDRALEQGYEELSLSDYHEKFRKPIVKIYADGGRMSDALEVYKLDFKKNPYDLEAQNVLENRSEPEKVLL